MKTVINAPLEIFTCEQGSPEWFTARMGIPTASEFEVACRQRGPRGGEPKGRMTYMLELIGERMTGKPKVSFSNEHTERGHWMEDEARRWYEMVTGLQCHRTGFIRRGETGASPDSLVGNDGMLEVKTKLPHIQLACILPQLDKLLLGESAGEVPEEHKAQVQGQLWIAEREWCDFVSYWPGLPGFRVRVHRDEPYIKQMSIYIDQFIDEIHELQAKFEKLAA
jgi:hypothetical protein